LGSDASAGFADLSSYAQLRNRRMPVRTPSCALKSDLSNSTGFIQSRKTIEATPGQGFAWIHLVTHPHTHLYELNLDVVS
jgi:hypothetical protein